MKERLIKEDVKDNPEKKISHKERYLEAKKLADYLIHDLHTEGDNDLREPRYFIEQISDEIIGSHPYEEGAEDYQGFRIIVRSGSGTKRAFIYDEENLIAIACSPDTETIRNINAAKDLIDSWT